MRGNLSKMVTELGETAQYQLKVGEELLPLNDLIGKTLTLTHTGTINCDACGVVTKKSYSQGHCYPCSQKLARCDLCVLKPETCHFSEGTCREPQWGVDNCMKPHIIYLANTSGLKVGLTKEGQIPTRWIDQGATQALPILALATRQLAGLVEYQMAQYVADKTNWRTMLQGTPEPLDLHTESDHLLIKVEQLLGMMVSEFGMQEGFAPMQALDEEVVDIRYPVEQYPTKISSHNFDKNAEVGGTLTGIKGQYLMFDTGVINIRKFTGYEVEVSHG